MLRTFTLFVLLATAGCTAQAQLMRRGELVDDGAGGPAPGGRIRYLVSSARWVMDAHRQDAKAKMFASCDGPYDVVREWDSQDGVVHGLFWSQMTVHHHLEFRCTPSDEIARKVMSGLPPLPSEAVAEVLPPPPADELELQPLPPATPARASGRSPRAIGRPGN